MQVSYNWLKELLDFNLTANEVIDLIQIYGLKLSILLILKKNTGISTLEGFLKESYYLNQTIYLF
jgi:hypothetical protein